MLISHLKKFIYVKTIKTASTSVEVFFEPFCTDNPDWQPQHFVDESVSKAGIIGARGLNAEQSEFFNHAPAEYIKQKVGEVIWSTYFKFTVVRNPFDKLISAFYFEKDMGKLAPDIGKNDNADEISQFRHWMNAGGNVQDRHLYCINNIDEMNFFIKYETLEADILQVCKRLDLEPSLFQMKNYKSGVRNTNIPIKEFYNEELIKKVKHDYAFEINKFGYYL